MTGSMAKAVAAIAIKQSVGTISLQSRKTPGIDSNLAKGVSKTTSHHSKQKSAIDFKMHQTIPQRMDEL